MRQMAQQKEKEKFLILWSVYLVDDALNRHSLNIWLLLCETAPVLFSLEG